MYYKHEKISLTIGNIFTRMFVFSGTCIGVSCYDLVKIGEQYERWEINSKLGSDRMEIKRRAETYRWISEFCTDDNDFLLA